MKNRFILLLLLSLPAVAAAQTVLPIRYAEYLEKVKNHNLSYASEKLNLSIAEADAQAAKAFSDPTLGFEYGNNDDHRMQMGQSYSVELGKTISFGKRRSRIALSQSEKGLAEALVEDFFRNLRAEATVAFLESVKQAQLYEVKLNSYLSIRDLARADSIKFSLGKITEVDAMQSRVEEGVVHNELLQAQNELYAAHRALGNYMGAFSRDTMYRAEGTLAAQEIPYSQGELLEVAVNRRSDLAAALKQTDIARKSLRVVRRERGLDFDLSLGYNHNTQVRNELAPAPKFSGITAGVTIPLKFSNFNRGAVRSAEFKAQQSEQNYRQAEIEVRTEVAQNYTAYHTFGQQVQRFDREMLNRSREVFERKVYSYNRGETSLLEVLTAQRTYNEVRTLYIETLFNHACSSVRLRQSVGLGESDLR